MLKRLGDWTSAPVCVDGYWKADVAEQAVFSWSTSPLRRAERLDLIGCQNDDMAAGAMTARDRAATLLHRPELREVLVTGVDGVADGGRAWVDQGQLAATILMAQTVVPALTFLAQAWGIAAAAGQPHVQPKTVMSSTSYPPLEVLSPSA